MNPGDPSSAADETLPSSNGPGRFTRLKWWVLGLAIASIAAAPLLNDGRPLLLALFLLLAVIPLGFIEALAVRSGRRRAGRSLEPAWKRRDVVSMILITLGVLLIVPLVFGVIAAAMEFHSSLMTWNASFADASGLFRGVMHRMQSEYFSVLVFQGSPVFLLIPLVPLAMALRGVPRGLAFVLLTTLGGWAGLFTSFILWLFMGGWGPPGLFVLFTSGAFLGAGLSLYPRRSY
jgi:hypothetical protein